MSTLNDIQQEILLAKEATAELNALEVLTDEEITLLDADSDSKVAFWRLVVWVQAFSIWTLHKLFGIYKVEIEQRIAQSRVHTKDWYREQALNYQHGHDLGDSAVYDNSGRTEAEVLAAKVIRHAAVIKVVINGRGVLRLKIAVENNGELEAAPEAVKIGFTNYINRVADAGTSVIPTTRNHDDLKLEVDLYYDPTILDNQGKRLDGTNDTPVVQSINAFLKGIKFNGKFIVTAQTDDLQQVQGVVLPVIKRAWSKFGNHTYTTTNVQNVGEINEIRVADAGYMRLDEVESVINYIAYEDD